MSLTQCYRRETGLNRDKAICDLQTYCCQMEAEVHVQLTCVKAIRKKQWLQSKFMLIDDACNHAYWCDVNEHTAAILQPAPSRIEPHRRRTRITPGRVESDRATPHTVYRHDWHDFVLHFMHRFAEFGSHFGSQVISSQIIMVYPSSRQIRTKPIIVRA